MRGEYLLDIWQNQQFWSKLILWKLGKTLNDDVEARGLSNPKATICCMLSTYTVKDSRFQVIIMSLFFSIGVKVLLYCINTKAEEKESLEKNIISEK